MTTIEVVGLGALNIDCLYRVERILDDGEAVVAKSISLPGGSAANTIYGLAKLGVNTSFAGVVGDDPEGRALVQEFKRVGVDTSQIKVKPDTKTGSVLCLSDKLGKRALYVSPEANNLLTTDDLDATYINQAGLLHISSFADDRQFKVLLKLAGSLGSSTKISFSPGALYANKGLKALSPILAKTYTLFTNQNEIRQLTGMDFKQGAEACLERGCHIVIVTLGEGASYKAAMATSYIRDIENEYMIEPCSKKIPALDTTGAGDAFATGFLYGLLNGKELKECGQLGDTVAKFSIAKIGARQGLPTLGELSQHYQALYNKQL